MPRTPSSPSSPRARKSAAEKKAAAELAAPAENAAVLPDLPEILPLLPIRDTVHFPGVIFPLFVGRDKSVRALDEAMSGSQHVVLVAQKQMGTEDPETSDLYGWGIVAEIMQILKVPDGTVRVMMEGIARARIGEYTQTEPFFSANMTALPESQVQGVEAEALIRSAMTQFEQVVQAGKNIPPEAVMSLMQIEDAGRLADQIAWHLPGLRVEAKQDLLETLDPLERLRKLSVLLTKEAEILEIQKNIRTRVEKEMGDTQREFILREQLKAIQQELGERDERAGEIDDYRTQVAESGMPTPVMERALKEVDRLEKMPPVAPEGFVIRTYLDTMLELPWDKKSEDRTDIHAAEAILDEDHYGLPKIKERILEFLAVRQLSGHLKGPILCFHGPPGVGKTSLGKSIARALGREFVRISLGGVRDEAEIRGHRRTYIGALPGRIVQSLKQAGTINPVFLLDEIDKMGADFRGDPSSALLEALDPEQNSEFSDHYLEVPLDLSDVMFLTTANLLDPIPPALRDRMEIIDFSGYTEDEKLQIARQFLLPKQITENGLAEGFVTMDDDTLRLVIREHTREAGVRSLERELGAICRKIARKVAEGNAELVTVGPDEVRRFLGQRKHQHGLMEEENQIGTATGLVYTEAGGDVIAVEVSPLPAPSGKFTLTGQLGDVMKESAQAALSVVRARAKEFGIDPEVFDKLDIHVHVPAGAVPKDGPSAGIALTTAMVSALTGRPVRRDLAMTGEITLRGRVLPIGGLKEKTLGAHRAGIRTILLPFENERDLEDIPEAVRADMTFHPVKHVDEVLALALLDKP